MANKMKRLLAFVLAIAICAGIGLPAFATGADQSKAGNFPINKTANGLDPKDQTDVTLTVPGTVEGYIDVVFILGGGMTANMETIESAISVFKPAMESGKATVRMGLISLEKGKEIILDLNSDEAVLDPATYVEFVTEKFDSINDLPYGTTNLHSQMLEAQKMLAAETKAKAENKYVFVLATGRTYWFDDANGEQATIVNKVNGTYYWGNYLWQSQRGGHTSLYMIPDRYNDSYEAFFADIEKWVAADGNKYVYTPHFDVNDYSAYVTWEQANNKDLKALGIASSRFGNGIVNPKPTADNFITGVAAGGSSGNNPSMALNYERAQYECVQVWKQLIASGYNCYSICSESPSYQNGSEYIKQGAKYTGTSTIQVGHAFMDYLAKLAGQGKAPVVWDFERDANGNLLSTKTVLQENFFDSVRDDMLYTCSVGSTVVDYIGNNENGNFEFIENADYIKLNVGGVDYTTAQVAAKEGANSSYAFTAPGASEPTFWLDYYYGNGKAPVYNVDDELIEDGERFVWTFGENVSLERLAHLTYKLQLTEKKTEEGTYTVPTNNSATLYPIDSEGKKGTPVVFPVPSVTYTVVDGTDIVIKKVDENGAPLTGATFALMDADGNTIEMATVNAEGELTFTNVKVGTYKLAEIVAPDGYVRLREDITFEVVYIKDHFEVNVKDRYILHFPATAYEISNHSYYPAIPQNFILLNDDIAEGWEYTGEYVFGESDFEVVYCADSTVGAENQYVYTNKAVEDVFSVEVAEQLRAIISNSYPYVTMEDMIAAATAAGVADAANLTRGDIIAAVQLAIWKCTNDADHTYRATYSVMNYPKWGKVFHDYTDELPDDLPKNTTKTMQDTAGAARVEALYDYLLGLEPLSAEESAINVVCYLSEDGKDASQTLIGATKNNTTITVKNHTQYDMDIVLALGAGIAKYDGVKSAYSHTYDSIVNLVEPLVLEGHNVKLGLVAVEHYDDVAMELTLLTEQNYKNVIKNGLKTIQDMPAGPTNLHSNLVAAQEMLAADKAVPDANKFFYVFATGRTYNYDNADGVPTTIINKVSVKGSTYYYWGHYLWQSQRGGHTSLYMIPDRYNNNFADYWADVVTWVGNDGDKYAYSFTDAYDVSNPQWFNTFYNANNKDLKALKIASSRYGWALTDLTNSGLAAIGSGSNPQNALNYERAQYEAYQVYADMASKYNCYALCTESPSYLNDSLYITLGAGYKGTSRIQLGHSFMDYLAKVDGQEKSTVLFKYVFDANNNPISTDFTTTNYFDGISIDTTNLVKTEKAPAKGPIMMSPAPKLPVVITNQPQSVVAEIGEKFAITVEAEGEGLTYQWYYRNKGGKDFAPSSFKGKTYAMTMAEYCHGREVYCVITNADGFSVTSDVAVIARPERALAITKQPESVSAAIGEKVVISVEAQGEGLTYQWYYRNKGGEEFAASSYKGKTYSITMAEYCHMREVYCVITDQNGNTVTTETVMMARPARQLQIVKQPESVVAAIGEKVVISVEAEGEGLTYQWFYRNKGGEEFAASSYKGKTYSITMAEYCNGREVYCVITDENGNTVTTETVMMSRPARQLQIVEQPEDVAVAIGEKVVISVEAEGDGLTYQWYYRNKNGKTFAASSYKGKTYSVSMAEYCDGREVYCVITDENGNTVRTETVSMSKAEN